MEACEGRALELLSFLKCPHKKIKKGSGRSASSQCPLRLVTLTSSQIHVRDIAAVRVGLTASHSASWHGKRGASSSLSLYNP